MGAAIVNAFGEKVLNGVCVGVRMPFIQEICHTI